MIPLQVENDFKTILNAFKRVGKGIYKNEKEAMQRIYSNTELLFANNVKQNPIFIKILCLLMQEYILKYGNAKQAVFMIGKNTDTKVDLLYFKIKELINTNELHDITEAIENGIINDNQQKVMIDKLNSFWTEKHIEKSIITLANDLIFNERANEL